MIASINLNTLNYELKDFQAPISMINLSELGVNLDQFQNKMRKFYSFYQPDNYLLSQTKIDILKNHLLADELKNKIDWGNIYLLLLKGYDIRDFLPNIPDPLFKKISDLKPTRWRLISEYKLTYGKDWDVKRIPSKPFEQKLAQVATGSLDYRNLCTLVKSNQYYFFCNF